MVKEMVTNDVLTDGTGWGHTVIAAHQNSLSCNILVATVHVPIAQGVPRGKGESRNLNSHHVPRPLPGQKRKPTVTKLHYTALITAPEIFFQARFPRNKCLTRAGRAKVNGERMVPCKAFAW